MKEKIFLLQNINVGQYYYIKDSAFKVIDNLLIT